MKYVGLSHPTDDALEKVTGSAAYTDDLRFPDLLWGKILTSPFAHARVKQIDTSRAEALPGVRAVLTYSDVPKTKFNRILRWSEDPLPATEQVLNETARFVGDRIAAVAADTEEIAQKAIGLIEVEYEELPAVFDPESALRADAPQIYPEGNLLKELRKECGDVDAAFAAEGAILVEDEIQTAMVHHGAIEPHICVARWGRGDQLEVWGPQQGVYRVQMMLGKLFCVSCSKIHVHCTVIGGTFGGKNGLMPEPVALLLSKKAGGKPVKIRYSRKESMISTYTRHGVKLYGRMALTPEGVMSGFSIESYMNAGPYCGGTLNVQSAMGGKMFKLYQAPSMRFLSRAVYTNTPVGGAMRGFGSPEIFASLELLVDKAASQLGMDPVELRRRNLVQPNIPDPISGASLGSARVRDCLERGAALFRWEEKRAGKAARDSERYAYGYGVATAMHGNGVAPFAPDITVAELSMLEDGAVLLRTGMTDHGAGTYTLLKQLVAEVLDLPMEEIDLTHSDTFAGVYDMGAGASRNTWSGGRAVMAAAEQLKEKLRALAAEKLGCPVEKIVLQDGMYCGEKGEGLSRAQLTAYAYAVRKEKLIESVSYNSATNAGSYGAHFAAVRVEKATGKIKVEEYLAVCDVGTPINPASLEGQMQGAIVMGMGAALWEGIRLDEKGVPQNAHLKKYHLPRASDMPPITLRFIENYEEGGPFGAKSVGEASIVPVVPAIVSAVNHALGMRFPVIPLTPERVLAALAER